MKTIDFMRMHRPVLAVSGLPSWGIMCHSGFESAQRLALAAKLLTGSTHEPEQLHYAGWTVFFDNKSSRDECWRQLIVAECEDTA